MWLRDRNYDLRQSQQQVRAATTPAQRSALLAQLQMNAQADQAELARLVVATGGAVERNFWVLSALAVEVPPAALPALRLHPRVARLVPVVDRFVSEVPIAMPAVGASAPPMPMATALDHFNHNIVAARTIISGAPGGTPETAKGEGVRIAFFDTGIDADESGSSMSGIPHRSFAVPNTTPRQSRIDVHLQAGLPEPMDCNNIDSTQQSFSYNPAPSTVAFRPCYHHYNAGHGTAVAAIAAGNAASNTGPSDDYIDGHAPLARVFDVSVTKGDANFRDAWVRAGWTTDTVSMLNAIEQVHANWDDTDPIHVLNISFDGWADPMDPVEEALDRMALDLDIVIVASASNIPDETRVSHGFYNGIAVGAVHARTASNASFVSMAETARGPLNSDWSRYYPDVCATGAGVGLTYGRISDTAIQNSFLQLPMIDVGDSCSRAGGGPQLNYACADTFNSPCHWVGLNQPFPQTTPVPSGYTRFGRGTSEAAPQVSGAAALYRAANRSATAEETRAAILLNVISPYAAGTAKDQHAYSSRNTFGLGYVRDDLLAEFAVRKTTIQPLHQVVSLGPAKWEQSATVKYGSASGGTGPLVSGSRYAVAICWPRQFLDESIDDVLLANVDLEVWSVGGTPSLLARSSSLANNYERVTFVAQGTDVAIVARLADVPQWLTGVPVQVVARQFSPDMDPATPAIDFVPVHASTGTIEIIGAGANCPTAQVRDIGSVARVVPQVYADAYGSRALNTRLIPQTAQFSGPDFQGVDLGGSVYNTNSGAHHHIVIGRASMGGPILIGGIAFRIWRPFSETSTVTLEVDWIKLEEVTSSPYGVTAGTLNYVPTSFTTVYTKAVSPALPWVFPGPSGGSGTWVPSGFNEFPLIVPFTSNFQYIGADLHIWIKFVNHNPLDFRVDGTEDGGPSGSYAMQTGNSLVAVGMTPVMAMLPPIPQQIPAVVPRLRAFGEPMVGGHIEVQLLDAPVLPSNQPIPVQLVIGSLAPGTGSPCLNFIPIPSSQFPQPIGNTDGRFGFASWNVAIPTSGSLLHAVFGFQAAFPTIPGLRSSALRLTFGGEL